MFGFLLKRDWEQPYRMIFWIHLGLFIICSAMFFLAFLLGPYNALEWLVTSETELVKVPLLNFNVGLFELELLNDNYVVKQYFEGSDIKIDPSDHVWFLLFAAIGIALLLTVITYFSTFWFTVSMGIFTVILIAFQLNQLQLFGTTGREALIGSAIIYLSVGFFFQSLRTQVGMALRLVAFFLVNVLIAIIIYQFSEVSQPFFYLANYGITGFLVLSLLFIFLIGHEVVFLILYLVTQSKGDAGGHNSTHFIIFTLIYIANVGLVYARNASYIDWDILYIHAFILLLLSAFIGLWTFERREEAYRSILTFYPYAGLLYMALGIICLATLRYQMVIANDPLLETFEDAIVFSHLAFGSMFFIYVIANYVNPLLKNMAVHRIVYQDNNFPYATAMLGGMIIVAALYYIANQAPLNQAISGYYNLIGDLHLTSKPKVARQYYELGADFGYQNHRSHYMLGQLDLSEKKIPSAIINFKTAIAKHPTPHAYINLSNVYRTEDVYFDALFTMQQAYADFPEDGAVSNNLGMLFSRTNITDSTLYFLQEISSDPLSTKVAQGNVLAVYIKKGISLDRDSLVAGYNESLPLPVKANVRAYSNKYLGGLGRSFDGVFASDSILNAHTLSYLINSSSDPKNFTVEQSRIAEAYGSYPFNGAYHDQLTYLSAWIKYQSGQIGEAIREIDVVSYNTAPQQSYYQHALGVLAMHQAAPRVAVDYFERSIRYRPSDSTNLVLSYLESGQQDKAMPLLTRLRESNLRSDLLSALAIQPSELISALDPIKYLGLRYRVSELDSLTIQDIISSFQIPAYQANAQLFLAKRFLMKNDLDQARFYLNQIEVDLDDNVELQRVLLENLAYLKEGDLRYVDMSASSRFRGNEQWDSMQKLYKAVEAKQSGSTDRAGQLFENLAYANPFFEEAVMQAVDHFNGQNEEYKGYEILLNAIDLNKYSVALIKAYVVQALKIKHEDYAESAIIRLIDLLSPQEFADYEREYYDLKTELIDRDDASVFDEPSKDF